LLYRRCCFGALLRERLRRVWGRLNGFKPGGREAYEHRFVLVRPDQHVAWAGDDLPSDVSALLRQVTGT
jgi:hypothetical protein